MQVLYRRIQRDLRGFIQAKKQIEQYRRTEGVRRNLEPRIIDGRLKRSESAHLLALDIVNQAIRRAEAVLAIVKSKGTRDKKLADLSALFATIAEEVSRVAQPATRFANSVLDRELSGATQGPSADWDPRELLFAAVCYGYSTDWRPDERLERASRLVSDRLSEHGLLPAPKPFYSTPEGFSVYTIGVQVIRSLAQLLEHVQTPTDPQTVRRMIKLLEETKVPLGESDSEMCGWHPENAPVPQRPTIWATAIALGAIDRIRRMLNGQINKIVLEHFTVTPASKREKEGVSLDSLVFPDSGLSLAPEGRLKALKISGPTSKLLEPIPKPL